ncbi:MAG: glycoside hydrolase family 2 protein [Muribaculaceae bacterium]|nr:glycoside hydrolase family 2 protein [Muribaculaceae bacterium]
MKNQVNIATWRGIKIAVVLLAFLIPQVVFARMTYNFNSGWNLSSENKAVAKMLKKHPVTLPHAWNEDESFKVSTYEMPTGEVWYKKKFRLPSEVMTSLKENGNRVFIEFEGARQGAEVFINGNRLGLSENGVMAFGFDLTPYIKEGDNLIEVRTDNAWDYAEQATGTTWQWNTKSFNVNYGGLPKNVWLHVTAPVYQTLPLFSNLGTTGTYIYGSEYDVPTGSVTINVESEVHNSTDTPVTRALDVTVTDMNGNKVASFDGAFKSIPAGATVTLKAKKRVSGLHFWSWGYGYLYDVTTTLKGGEHSDAVTTTTGFRKIEFKNGMIYLNDRVMMVHGYAQRTTNEWPGVGQAMPAWLSDYSNDLLVKSGGNLVRWMHTCPGKQDVESCDRVGLIQAMPAGDAERDSEGRKWTQRLEVMRDAIIYNRNSPSILFYECGNQRISSQHMKEMLALRNQYDPNGGRAIGSREMLDKPEAEYGGEMLYINKSDTKPMWMMEYCRDEALRFYWNSWSYPFHQEGDGPLYRNASAAAYNHNNDEFVAELVRRWYDYWIERPGSGTKVNSGGAKIIFSDTQSHGRSADNYRVSGVVDPMRVEKDAFFAHQVMWDGWVDDLKPRTYIVGHWNYEPGFVVPTVYVVSNADSVVLSQNGNIIQPSSHDYRFLYTFKNVKYEGDRLTAISYDKNGKEVSRHEKVTAGHPVSLKLTAIENPTGWKADGNDVVLVQFEVVDAEGRRCPLDNRLVKFSLKGPAEWRGGIAKNKPFGFSTNQAALTSTSASAEGSNPEFDEKRLATLNHVLCDTLPVECGVNRVMLRSLAKPGKVRLTAKAEGLPDAEIEFSTIPVTVIDGLTTYKPSDGLKPILDRGATPAGESFEPWRREVAIIDAVAGSGNPTLSFDTYENTAWESAARLDSAWVTYTLSELTNIDEVCLKMKGFRSTSYPIQIYAHPEGTSESVKIWEGWTPKGLGFAHLPIPADAPKSQRYTVKLVGSSTTKDAFGAIQEMDSRNNEKASKGSHSLKIIEIEFLRNLK